jgi:hypothetical protein
MVCQECYEAIMEELEKRKAKKGYDLLTFALALTPVLQLELEDNHKFICCCEAAVLNLNVELFRACDLVADASGLRSLP